MLENTKILYVITKSGMGGAGHYVYDLAVSFSKKGSRVSVAMGGEGELKQKLDKLKIQTHSIDKLERDVSISNDLRVFFSLIKLIRKENPDIVHVNSSKIGGLGALATRTCNVLSVLPFIKTPDKKKIKVVLTAHGWAHKEKRSATSKYAIRFISWLTVLFSNKVIAVSEDDKRKSPKLFIPNNRIRVIHNGPTLTKFMARKNSREKMLSSTDFLEKDTFIFGDLAELHKNKGLTYALEAFASLLKDGTLFELKYKHLVFVLIGGGEEEEFLRKKTFELEIQDKVIFMGHIPQGSSLLKGFDAFIFPSIKEGFPYSLLEAGHAGLPSIASDTGGIPEIITDMNSGILVRPANTEELRQAMRYLVLKSKKRAEMGRNFKEYVTKEFSLDKMMLETESLYKEIIFKG